MNKDGCRNCKNMIHTGLANIMRCGIDQEMVNSNDICENYKLNNAQTKEIAEVKR